MGEDSRWLGWEELHVTPFMTFSSPITDFVVDDGRLIVVTEKGITSLEIPA